MARNFVIAPLGFKGPLKWTWRTRLMRRFFPKELGVIFTVQNGNISVLITTLTGEVLTGCTTDESALEDLNLQAQAAVAQRKLIND